MKIGKTASILSLLLIAFELKGASSGAGLEGMLYFFAFLILFILFRSPKIPSLKTREIAGIKALEEAIGRSTEMGKPILFISGTKPVPSVSAVAGMNVLGRIAKLAARYGTPIVSPHNNSITMIAATEEIKEGLRSANNEELFRDCSIFYLTDSQFPYAAGINALTSKVRPGAIFYMGTFYAESLILTEHGQNTGAIQIAGTDSVAQIPFFITTCDYLLMGEELFAASAYIQNDEASLRSIFMLDLAKAATIAYILIKIFVVNL
ncbi:hypothetical protein KAR04_00775 [Candidatus Calescamantes bacterium]|nr:hypothetical protein [Candidatus Calescamantes bacterium]